MKKFFAYLLTICMLVFISGCAKDSKPASSGEKEKPVTLERSGVIATDGVNVRKGPGRDFDVIGTFNDGEKIRILQSEDGFTEVIREDGTKGWVSNWYYAELVYGKDKNLPEQILFQLDTDGVPISMEMCPKQDVPLKASWKKDAPETGKIKAEERVKVLEYKAVVKPKGTTTYNGKKIYVLSPGMGIEFFYYVDGLVKRVWFNKTGYKRADDYIPGWEQAFKETNEAPDGFSFAVHVRGKDVDGWIGSADQRKYEWYREPGSGPFISPQKQK